MAKKMDRIFDEIKSLSEKEQKEFLALLPKVLNLSPEDLLWARLAESAFNFWDNPEDAIYDDL
jgi:hypothetical protein